MCKNSKRRWLAIALALAMLLTLLPIMAFAESHSSGPTLNTLKTWVEENPGQKLPFTLSDWLAGPNSTFRISADAIGYDGRGWCADAFSAISPISYMGAVYISTSLPEGDHPINNWPWDKINWILNNWEGREGYTWREAQLTILTVIHDFDRNLDEQGLRAPVPWIDGWDQGKVDALAKEADANAGFVPGVNDVVAVGLLPDNIFPGTPESRQMVIIELPKDPDLVFKGETAWAANGDEPGELRYNTRGNWATYVEYEAKTSTLFAGQTIDVGTVKFSEVADGLVTITVTLGGDWEFKNVEEFIKVQDYEYVPSGNPAPGLFEHKLTDLPGDTKEASITVPANNYYGVHVEVGRWVPEDY